MRLYRKRNIINWDTSSSTFCLTTAQMYAIACPEKGLLVFNTDLNNFNIYDGNSWVTCDTISLTNSDDLVDGFVLVMCIVGFLNSLFGVIFTYYNL